MTEPKKLWPWITLAGPFFLLFTSIGLINGMTLFYIPVAEALGVSLTRFSIYYTLGVLGSLLAMPLAGKIFTKYYNRTRLIIFVSGLLNILCLLLFARANTVWEFYVISVIRSVGTAGLSTVPATMIINSWFIEKRSLATSIAFIGSGFGGLFYTQLSKYFLAAYGWRVGYIALAGGCAVTLVLALVFSSPSPEAAGRLPLGSKEERASAESWGLTLAQAYKTAGFWVLGIAFFIAGVVVMGVQQPMSSALQQDFGHSQEFSASVVSVFLIVVSAGKLIIGWIFDRFGLKTGIIYSGLLLIVSLLMMCNAYGAAAAYAFAVIFGLGNMNSTVTSAAVTSAVFGTREYGTIYGFLSALLSGGMALGPILTSRFYDVLGSYRGAWILYIVLSVVVAALLIYTLGQRKKLEAEYPGEISI
ncbi:MAG: MFS transporter [Oscillospiraceae bacterium]|jgi:MFS family permease